MKKVAVVLFNLGGPDSLSAVQPFLFNLFNDAAIIRAPAFIRKYIAAFISKRRGPIAQEIRGSSRPVPHLGRVQQNLPACAAS